MVLGVCRRVLGNDCDADDAFQATFLVLARKSGFVGWRQSVGNWLYSVAYRIASKQRVERARRYSREREVSTSRTELTNENPAARELSRVLDEELERLPERYRMPLLLCCLQDQTIDEAARQLGWTFPMVKGRLQRGRELLRDRLRRRGFTLSVGVLASILTEGIVKAVPLSLLNITIQAAVTGTMTVAVAAHVKGAMQAMFWTKIKTAVVVLAAISVVGLGAGLGSYWAGQPGEVAHAVAVPNPPQGEKKANVNEPIIIENKNNGETISVPVGSIVEVRLAGTRNATGWEFGAVKGESLVHINRQKGQAGQPPSRPGLQALPFGSEFQPEPKAADQAIGTYIFIFQAVKEGPTELNISYVAPGGPGVTSRRRAVIVASFRVTINVTPQNEKKANANEPVIVENKQNGETLSVPVGSIVEVRLAGTRNNTGWEAAAVKGESLVHINQQKGQAGQPLSRPGLQPLPFGSEFLPEPKAVDRAIGTYVFIFQAVKEGRSELNMSYIAPGGPAVTARLRSALIATFKVTIDVTAAKPKSE